VQIDVNIFCNRAKKNIRNELTNSGLTSLMDEYTCTMDIHLLKALFYRPQPFFINFGDYQGSGIHPILQSFTVCHALFLTERRQGGVHDGTKEWL